MSTDPKIIDAATVIVLRDSDDGPEVFMVRRHGKSSFMANAWVYPGGRVDDADAQPEALSHIIGTPQPLGLASDTRQAGFYLAAIRETFEEAGILLARRRDDQDWIDLEEAPQFAEYRTQLQGYERSLTAIADDEDLVFPVEQLRYFAHWVTPTFEPKRFDTYFFLARAPQRQNALHDAKETTDSFWIQPHDVLRRFEAGELYLAPPTERTLGRLCGFESVDEIFAAADDFEPPCIIPHLLTTDDSPVLLLPGDPEYPTDDPAYADATPVHGQTRMRLVLPGR